MITDGQRRGRIELRTTDEEKRLLAAAAAHEQMDLTAFVLRAAMPAAREALERAERIALSRRDAERVLELLDHPAPPTPALLAAVRRRRERERAAHQQA
ncbi:MAG: DUF1778 domain-containing protein [Dehalococcoidia bacterium]|nr:DUF1778 domain-containing protein [Dehalococcoidia bacterium]